MGGENEASLKKERPVNMADRDSRKGLFDAGTTLERRKVLQPHKNKRKTG